MKNLYMFDIDGTLVDANHLHTISYKKAYKYVLGIDVSEQAIEDQFGEGERETHIAIFKELGIPFDESLASRITKTFSDQLIKSLQSEKITPLDGVVQYLTTLRTNGDYLGVVTGNLEKQALLTLQNSGLRKFFSIVSYDDGTKSKEQIVGDALKLAKSERYQFGRIVVVGDTLHDIYAGKSINAFTVGVNSGARGSTTFELLEKNADLALHGLREYKKIIAALNQ